MKIKIVGIEKGSADFGVNLWYKNKIGEVFEVINKFHKGYTVYQPSTDRVGYVYHGDYIEVAENENWWEGLDDADIINLKGNRTALVHLKKNMYAEWMADAFRAMPSEDLVFLNNNAEWIKNSLPIFNGWIYRLREDWERPDDKSELVKLIEKWEDTLKRITEPLDLIGSRPVRDAMQQALEAGLCEYHIGGKWRPVGTKTDFAIRLAPDWREKLKTGDVE